MTKALLILQLTSALTAADAPEAIFRAAIEDFEFGEHAAAAEKLRSLLDPVRLSDPEDVIVARQYLGACHHLLGDPAAAEWEFTALLALDPDHRLDPEVFSPAVVQLYEAVRANRSAAATAASPPSAAATATATAIAAPEPEPAPPPVLVVDAPVKDRHPAALGLVPFGVGQFLNRHPVRGAIFATLEVGLLAGSGVALSLFANRRARALDEGRAAAGPDGLVFDAGYDEEASDLRRLQTTGYVLLISGLAVVVAGVIEALISWPGEEPAAESAGGGHELARRGSGL